LIPGTNLLVNVLASVDDMTVVKIVRPSEEKLKGRLTENDLSEITEQEKKDTWPGIVPKRYICELGLEYK